ncbi:Oidioi.mRNA.OKI2018_I69.chr2.g8145.t1.cds [Oikopleura dioica]|uniref:Oidioi.mRNA.OKI2018_I69.chr2.g8145.t1.cds n=1 Tax=Oikopleura dioica TaxID=34765 RepID=A0ABN7TEV5_OIKDI|nr:Oidioi.mRNA.OKI2018_I69.chr2.g8145.t1.cds [Oikopleura dioica]
MNRILLTSPRSVLGTLLSSFQALPGSMFSNFNFKNFKCAAASLSAGLVGVGAFWYYYSYLNDDSRIPKTKHRGIEILYQEHENFAALRKNWKITLSNLLSDAERCLKAEQVEAGVRLVCTAAALVALVQNEKEANSLLNSLLCLPDFKKHESLIRDEIKEDMDAVELIIKGEMSDISTATLKELRESTGGQTEGS